uniref:Nuclear pore complex protein NUP96 C-terminal domain-containing protein n=1 Tax=Aureoumbra lagunensis TaxID=44058 RepID=A0A7S3NH63_9STRA|mmetsp:Transcript_20799/g.31817  ORF Transcript_20799/g.31817 Transcript_20799/m.31817 type:complete len:902 (+) Transcript_20799:25-2730(+)|eukprot:CAMPEP_0197322242 /NCGR_PEP_ID=MMETSP0891-20130614/68886_1 /TAXON_ID=44058 ORGANISM="Aureoumbra lagunensis, Strain CCMP1510" /NCGR_SAMPLE_ID=MMETSP0891 /ASSEMBLY_ACC=CAM_ASM_000534 /LENGTH=901 /DNA_ID=CAMNT_0042814539 /DNA_START=39 /DNA_END=2744 /DNA_ORIENTATION=+
MVRIGLIADDDLSDDELEEEIIAEERTKQDRFGGIFRLAAPRDDEDLPSTPNEERLTYSPGGLFTCGDFAVDRSGRGDTRRENMGLSAQMGIESPSPGTRLALSPQAGYSSPSSGSRRRRRIRSSPLVSIESSYNNALPPTPSNHQHEKSTNSFTSSSSQKTPPSLAQNRQRKRQRRSSAAARERSRRSTHTIDLTNEALIECTELLKSAHVALGAKPKPLASHARDYGLSFGRSFRASISITGCVASSCGTKIKLRRLRFIQVPSAPFELMAKMFPPTEKNFSHLILSSESRQLEALTERYAKLAVYQDSRLAVVWNLVMALWFSALDDIQGGNISPPSMVDRRSACARDRRFEAVAAWFAQRVKDNTIHDIDIGQKQNSHVLVQKIFELLCQRRVDEAASACASAGKTRLALLVASSGDAAAKRSLGLELERLEQNTTDAESALLARVVGACAGRLELEDELGRLGAQLPWPKRFGLHLWYQRKPGESLSRALRSYDLAVSTGAAEAPTNARLESSYPIPQKIHDEQQKFSNEFAVEYRLIQLACALGSNTFGDDYPCQVLDEVLPRLLNPFAIGRCAGDAAFAWPLLLVLEAAQRGFGPMANVRDLLARLADTLIFQLLCEKRVNEALFVIAVSFPIESQRTRLAKQLLDRFPDIDQSMNQTNDQKFIRAVVRPPESWVYAARALDLRHRGDWPAETTALLKAHHFSAAHESLLRNAATSRALFADANKVRPLLEALANDFFETPDTPPEEREAWQHGAGFFLDYLRFLDRLHDDTSNALSSRDTLSQLRTTCDKLKKRISTFPTSAKVSNTPVFTTNSISIGAGTGLTAAIHTNLEAASKQYIFSDIATTDLALAKSLDKSIGAGDPNILNELTHADALAPSARRVIIDDLATDLLS